MQEEALMSLRQLRESGEHKGLVISATGTGKTILYALDVIISLLNFYLLFIMRVF